MMIIPAIDLLAGSVVRLRRGNYSEKTIFPGTPEEYLERWQNEGAKRIHIVDLEGARSGQVKEWDILERLTRKAAVPLELGGGLRNLSDVERAVQTGMAYVVLGTAAIENKAFLSKALERFSDRILVGADCRDGLLCSEGWVKKNKLGLAPFCRTLEKLGAKSIVYTNIELDVTLKGPDVSGLKKLLEETELSVILSGGISSMDDLRKLAEIRNERFIGVICGRALYEGTLRLSEACRMIHSLG